MNVVSQVFEGSQVSLILSPSRPPDLCPCNFDLWGNPRKEAHSNNPHTLYELKHNICETVTSVEVSKLLICVILFFFKRPEVCLRAEGKYFEVPL
jgi:hypothetical protein